MPILVPGTLSPPQDRRVWPPEEPEGEGEDRSTQPFPAIRENRPLPMPLRRPAPQPREPEGPEAQEPDAQEPGVQEPGAQEPDAAEAAAPGRRSPRRGVLVGAGAVLSVALAVGIPGWFRYNVYTYGRPADHVHLVQPGQAGVLQHVSWQADLQRISDPSGKPETPGRQWVKVVATRTALDGEGAIRHGKPDITLTDRAGRTWHAEEISDNTPFDVKDNKVGTPYRMELLGVVPPAVADQVEVLLRPNPARDVPGQSVDDMMKSAAASDEKNDQVLRFRR
jgi:hypothetical protein